QDLWDSCNQWGVVIDVYIAAKRSKSGHRFCFVRFKNVNDINMLEERSGDITPNEVGVSGNNDASNSGEKPVGVSVKSVKNSKVLNELFLELKDVSYDFIPDERCVWIDFVGFPLASWAPEVKENLKKDKIKSKPDKNEKRGEAGKSQKQLQ
nr:nucleotide-binding alpha-beta plait domain-containing protein [Tanacetum cinerariifolium]